MIREAYVSFEVAKLLKEKGFNERTLCYYISNGEIRESMCPAPWNNGVMEPIMICAPTQQKAMAWLREVHKLPINIWYDKEEDTPDNEVWTSEIAVDRPSYILVGSFASYEEACETALKYSLENLI